MTELTEVTGPVGETDDAVQKVDYQLPMSAYYPELGYYVRRCYHVYYEMIVNLLKGQNTPKPVKYITVSGTPGIGNSVFYIYFFQRWIKDHPASTIVTASYNKERSLKRCVLFDKEHPSGLKCKEIPDIDQALHLYDGPPTVEPQDNSMVCFTSHEKSWLNSIVKQMGSQEVLYMPVWSLTELYKANDLLKLKLKTAAIESRYKLFGGAARYCLVADDRKFFQHELELKGEISEINSFQGLTKCLNNPSPTHCTIFSISPCFDTLGLPTFYELDFCSKQVALLVNESIVDKSRERLSEFSHWLKGHNECANGFSILLKLK